MRLYKLFLVLVITIMVALSICLPRAAAQVETPVIVPVPVVKALPLTPQDHIRDFATKFKIGALLPLTIAKCESRYVPTAKNPDSSAKGLFQFLDGTWRRYSLRHWGEVRDVLDPIANAELGVWVIATYGTGDWMASSSCWDK